MKITIQYSVFSILKKSIQKLSKKLLIATLALIVIAVPLIYLTVLNQKEAKAAWYAVRPERSRGNDSWLYRKAITITVTVTSDRMGFV